MRPRRSIVEAICIAAVALSSLSASASAEQLPLRHYGVYEGLPHSSVRCIFQDSRGYLWIGTGDGLARFDGYRFVTYDTSDGLGHSFINAITEDPQGRIWVATNGGGVSCFVDWMIPAAQGGRRTSGPAPRKFLTFRLPDQMGANLVNSFLFAPDGRLWCVTDGGLFRSTIAAGPTERIQFDLIAPRRPYSAGALADSKGRLWFGNGDSIVAVVGDKVITYGPYPDFNSPIICFAEDAEGRLLAASEMGLFQLIEPPGHPGRGVWKPFSLDVAGLTPLHHMIVDRGGALWVGAEHGVIKYVDGKRVVYTTANGLASDNVHALDEDRDRNLWLGTYSDGLSKLSGQSVVAFGRSDGLPDDLIAKILEDRSGHLYVSFHGGGIYSLEGGKAVPIEWSERPGFTNIDGRILQDGKGDFWIGTDEGLFWSRGPDLRLARPRRITTAEGWPNAGVTGDICEDQRGVLWLGSQNNDLYRIERSGRTGSPVARRIALTYPFPYRRLISDRNGSLWISANTLLSRVIDEQDSLLQPAEGAPDLTPQMQDMWARAERKLPPSNGLPEVNGRALFVDSRGWLWIGLRYKGVALTKSPGANALEFTNYTTEDGLSSNTVWSISEDNSGRMYFGTGRGLDRFDLATGRINHITAGEKLVGDSIMHCIKDREGNIWVSSATTVLKLDSRSDSDGKLEPPVYLSRVQAGGEDVRMPDAGVTRGPLVTLGRSNENLLIEYVGLDFHSDRELKYQYKLEGADRDWSTPTDQRSVNYAGLAPGVYTFLVRAVNEAGVVSREPASIQLRVLPPIWRRWWFVTAAALLLALGVYSGHRYRVARLVEMLEVRARIASDLHDDIGSNLTRIAILSEVANRQLEQPSPAATGPLSSIARISRESVASMADIVWAVDPRRDTHQDLVRRMRQFAIELLASTGATFRMSVSGEEHAPRLGPDFRRQVFLIFKESINNAARHSACSAVEVVVEMDRGGFALKIEDNGRGFELACSPDGQGLLSMQRRAAALNGQLKVTPAESGTSVTLFVPWRRSRVKRVRFTRQL
ncbi:MAG TPA: two-component regulator propeller domain-containing protein [Blastocatellia bacterium]|nr:two-component regulator propeller domain-containing protein [Blastocatellia bacterium]